MKFNLYMGYNGLPNVFKSKRFENGRGTSKNAGSSHPINQVKHLYPSSKACFSETSRDEVTFRSPDVFFSNRRCRPLSCLLSVPTICLSSSSAISTTRDVTSASGLIGCRPHFCIRHFYISQIHLGCTPSPPLEKSRKCA